MTPDYYPSGTYGGNSPDSGLLSPEPVNRALEARRIGLTAAGTSFIFLGTYLVQILLGLFFPGLIEGAQENTILLWILSMAPMYLIAMPLSLIFFSFAPSAKKRLTECRRITVPALIGLFFVCMALSLLGSILGNVVNSVLESLTGSAPSYEVEDFSKNSPWWVNLLLLGILAPVLEEIFYRKLVLDRLRAYGELPAVLISGLIFGAFHGNFNQFFYATFIGFLFGAIYLYSGKLRYTIALHVAFNCFGGVMTAELTKRVNLEAFDEAALANLIADPVSLVMFLAYFGVVLLALPVGIVTLALLSSRVRFSPAVVKLRARDWLCVLLPNAGVWILIVTAVLGFLI